VNWYKVATEAAVAVTSERFGVMTPEEKRALARNTSISPQTQRLFFKQNYEGKKYVLRALALNAGISQQTQQLFFTQEYEDKDSLQYLAGNPSITPEVQRLFFTEEYKGDGEALRILAWNTSISPLTQQLFFTEPYERKNQILQYLAENPSFLRGEFTTGQWRSIKNAARGSMRLLILSKRLKRLEQVIGEQQTTETQWELDRKRLKRLEQVIGVP